MAKSDAAVSTTAASVSDIDFSGIMNLNDALAALNAAGIQAEQIEEYGDGFVLLPTAEKRSLVGVPFAIMDASIRVDSATGREYWSFSIVTGDSRKLIVNDGSVGLAAQASEIAARRGSLVGLVVTHGLSGGEYTTTLPNGEKVTASTFYFAGV
jgi:hypothetical protein